MVGDSLAIDTLLIDLGPGETRVAALAGDEVVEVYHHRPDQPGAGAVYRGRVAAPLPDGSSVFVEIGLERPGLMQCGGKLPPEGQAVLIEIVQPPRGEKGAKVREAKAHKNQNDISALPVGVVTPAQHPVQTCAESYVETLTSVIMSAPDQDGSFSAMLGPKLTPQQWGRHDNLFDHFGVEEVLEHALEPTVPFSGGGSLIIEPTAALIAVDIDAGPMPAAEANIAAMPALARALRMRAIAGPIIVDLIPVKDRGRAVEVLKQAVASDPVPTRVVGLTPEGRIELNRRRLRPSLTDLLLDPPSPADLAIETVAYMALRQCVREGLGQNATRMTLVVHGDVIALLRGSLRSALDEAESTLKMPIALAAAVNKPRGWTDIQI